MHSRTTRRCICAFVTYSLLWAAAAAGQKPVIIRPADTGAILVNPGMGWVFHHYDNSLRNYGTRLEPWDTVDDFPGVGVIYLRLAWSYLEPEEGKFNWSLVDIPAQRWIAKGKRIAFRFSCDEDTEQQPAVPLWVRKAGARGYYSRQDGRGISHVSAVADSKRWAVDFDDPVFLDKFNHFLAAAAARYDGDPNVAFIDVGSLGIWGEGDPREFPYSAATVRRHVELHRKHFKRTLIALSDNASYQGRGGEKLLVYAAGRGVTMRDDSILVWGAEDSYFSHIYAGHFWPKLPVILESQHYGISAKSGHWADGDAYLRAVEDFHASYVSVHWWPREFLAANRKLVDRISARMGYRLQLVEAALPEEVAPGGQWNLAQGWRNGGVAPCLPGGYVCYTLKGDKGGIAGVFVDERFDVRSLPVGAPGKGEPVRWQSAFTLPFASILKPGTYEVFVSVGSRIGTPRIALPLAGGDGNMRYRIGTVRVVDSAPAEKAAPVTEVPTPPASPRTRLAAARPLIEPAIEISGAKSLPWADPARWDAVSPAYNPENLVEDTLALLGSEAPVIVRMETLRRATVYSRNLPRAAQEVKARLAARVRVAEENGKADVLALFDLGYLVEACKQAEWLDWNIFDEPNGYALLRRAERAGGTTPEMEFAAALMLAEPAGQIFFTRHLKFAVAGAEGGTLLAQNLVIHFRDRGRTLAELKAAKIPR